MSATSVSHSIQPHDLEAQKKKQVVRSSTITTEYERYNYSDVCIFVTCISTPFVLFRLQMYIIMRVVAACFVETHAS